MKLRIVSITALLIASGAQAFAGEHGKVLLKSEVELQSESIRLSDLLPSGVPLAWKESASAIDLGRAPRVGSVRVLEPAEIMRKAEEWSQPEKKLAVPTEVVIRRRGWPIDKAAVRDVIRDFLVRHGWKEGELPELNQLESAATASEANGDPTLEVTGMERDRRGGVLQFRLRCASPAHCSNFLVRVPLPNAHTSAISVVRSSSATEETGDTGKSAKKPLMTGASRCPACAGLAQAGQTATLILENENIRITLLVICLERGALGQRIRVREARGQRVFVAEVTGSGLLRAAF